MKDLTGTTWIEVKGGLFLLLGLSAAVLLVLGESDLEERAIVGIGDLVFLPRLLLRVLRH